MSKVRDAIEKAKRQREALLASGTGSLGQLKSDPDTPGSVSAQPVRAAPRPKSGRVVQIDHAALRQSGLLAPDTDNQARQLADEYRQIKRPLISNAEGSTGVEVPYANLIMVSGAVSGEGKTFTCINLSLSMAQEKDWSVVLVDGDIAKPQLTNLFGLADEPGLLDVLRTPDLQAEACIVATDLPGISILPAGHRDEQATELLASRRMQSTVRQLAEADPNRIILFDSPPMLMTTEAAVLASQMGQVVVVVRAGHTTHQQVEQTISKIDPQKAVSLILNQAELGSDSLAYGGQYGYYGYGQTADGYDAAQAPL